jgi:hypothetical protein
MIRTPFLNLFFIGFMKGVLFIIDAFPIGLTGSSSMMITFSVIVRFIHCFRLKPELILRPGAPLSHYNFIFRNIFFIGS